MWGDGGDAGVCANVWMVYVDVVALHTHGYDIIDVVCVYNITSYLYTHACTYVVCIVVMGGWWYVCVDVSDV